MKKILISTYAGSSNKGTEALVRGLSTILEEKFGKNNIELSLSSIQPLKDKEQGLPAIVHNIYRFSCDIPGLKGKLIRKSIYYANKFGLTGLSFYLQHFDLFNAIKRQDLFIEMGADNYDLEYGGYKLLYEQHKWIKRHTGVKMLLYDLSLNENSITQEFIDELNRFDIATVRETVSKSFLKKMYRDNKVYLVPDPAFIMNPETVDLPDIMKKYKCVGVNLSDLILKSSYGKNLKAIASANYYILIDNILDTTDMGVVLFPHVMRNQDLSILRMLYERYKDNKRVYLIDNENLKASQLKYIISRFRFLVTARTHASIAAYSSCVPTLVLGYSTKSIGIATDLFGTADNYVISVKDLKDKYDLWNRFQWILSNEDIIGNHLKKIMPNYQLQTKKIGYLIETII